MREGRGTSNKKLFLRTHLTYDLLLKHLWAHGHEQAVKDVLSDMRKRNMKPTQDGGAALLAMYAKQNNRKKYREVYQDLKERLLLTPRVLDVVLPHLVPEGEGRKAMRMPPIHTRAQFEADIAITLKKLQSSVLSTSPFLFFFLFFPFFLYGVSPFIFFLPICFSPISPFFFSILLSNCSILFCSFSLFFIPFF